MVFGYSGIGKVCEHVMVADYIHFLMLCVMMVFLLLIVALRDYLHTKALTSMYDKYDAFREKMYEKKE
jgi:hypothetical protein